MTEPKGYFERADLLPAPDLWEEARRRSTGPRQLPPGPPGASRARRIAAASVALAVFAAAALFAWDTLRPEGAPVQEQDVNGVTGGAFDDLPAGWIELPPPPDVRTGAATAWTGTELLVWGGFTDFDERNVLADGFVFDATERAWRPTALAPLAPRTLSASAWTGSELLVWGGWRGIYGVEYAREFFDDGAAYDPVSDSWRVLPPAPIDARAPLSVWTGQELLVWGTAVRVDDRPRDGAAYDPASDSWRTIAEAPIELTDATAVWTGKEMIVFGAALCCGNRPERKTAIGAAYDPASDTWRRLPDSELSPQASTAAWNGTEMIAWDYLNGSAAYDPTTDTWRDLPRVPLEDYECSPESVAVGGYVFGDYCGALALYDPVDDAWRNVNRRDLTGWEFELVPATPAAVLLARDYQDTSRTRAFAYRPSTTEWTPTAAGTITVPADAIPEGALLLQTNGGAEVLRAGSERSGSVPGIRTPLDLSSDGSAVLGSTDGNLVTTDLRTAESRLLVRPAEGDVLGAFAQWSPDGSMVAYSVGTADPAGRSTLCVLAVASEEPSCFAEVGRVYTFDWSPDGSRIVVAGPPAQPVRVVDVATGEVSEIVPQEGDTPINDAIREAGMGQSFQLVGPTWSPSGSYLAALANLQDSEFSYVPVVFTPDGRFVAFGRASGEYPEPFEWSPVADVLAYTRGEAPYRITEAYLLDPGSGEDRVLVSGEGTESSFVLTDMAWAPSGRWLAIAGWEEQGQGRFRTSFRVLDAANPSSFRQFSVDTGDVYSFIADWGP